MQAILVLFINQLVQNSTQIKKALTISIKKGGKTIFKDWFYALGYHYSISLAIYIYTISLCVFYPLLPMVAAIFFALKYYFDKYTVLFVHPAEFETRPIRRKVMF